MNLQCKTTNGKWAAIEKEIQSVLWILCFSCFLVTAQTLYFREGERISWGQLSEPGQRFGLVTGLHANGLLFPSYPAAGPKNGFWSPRACGLSYVGKCCENKWCQWNSGLINATIVLQLGIKCYLYYPLRTTHCTSGKKCITWLEENENIFKQNVSRIVKGEIKLEFRWSLL